MTEKYNIDNVLPLLDIVIEAGNVAGEIAQMQNPSWFNYLGPCGKLLDEVLAIFKVNYSLVVPELTDISDEEFTKIEVHFNEKFDIPQEELESTIQNGLIILKDLVDLVRHTIDFAKNLKKK